MKHLWFLVQRVIFRLSVAPEHNWLIVDLDNTLYDTEKLILTVPKPKLYRTAKLSTNMKKFILELAANRKLVFLTARNPRYLMTTRRVLRRDFSGSSYRVIVVDRPEDKLWFLFQTTKRPQLPTIYVDDLSYNAEHGKRLFYNDIISATTSHEKIEYIGYSEIRRIHEEGHHSSKKIASDNLR